MGDRIRSFKDLEVYRQAFAAAMRIFELTKVFPKEERYALVDQIRRSSRSVCANIAEAFYKRTYPAAFSSRLSDSVSEAAETQVWLDFANECEYLADDVRKELFVQYDFIIGKLIIMIKNRDDWRI